MKSKVLRRSIAAEVPSGIWFQVHCKSICLALWLLIVSSFSVRMSSLQYKKIQITQPSSLRNESGLIYRTSGNPALGWPHSRLWAGELRTSAAKKLAVGLRSPDRWYIMVFVRRAFWQNNLCVRCAEHVCIHAENNSKFVVQILSLKWRVPGWSWARLGFTLTCWL